MLCSVNTSLWCRNMDHHNTLTKRSDAFEMWTCRRMLRISGKEHKCNEEVLNMMKTSLKLMKIIKKGKCEYLDIS